MRQFTKIKMHVAACAILVAIDTVGIASPAVATSLSSSDAALIRRIAVEVKHYRSTTSQAALRITAIRTPAAKMVSEGFLPKFAIQHAAAPNDDIETAYWITTREALSFTTISLGNLGADDGNGEKFPVSQNLIDWHNHISVLHVYRGVTASASSHQPTYTFLKIGDRNVTARVLNNKPICEGLWQGYEMDPRYLAYFADDKPLDRDLVDPHCGCVVVSRDEPVDGSSCIVVQMSTSLPHAAAYVTRCWIDSSHDDIIRKIEGFELAKGDVVTSSTRPDFVSVAPQIFKVRDRYYIGKYESTNYVPPFAYVGHKITKPITICTSYVTISSIERGDPKLAHPFRRVWDRRMHVEDDAALGVN